MQNKGQEKLELDASCHDSHIFDCYIFNCGTQNNDSSKKFGCDAEADFACGGPDYNCVVDFDCSSGHGFFCINKHDCKDLFSCNGGQTASCSAGGQAVPVSCTPGPVVQGYSGAPGGNGNNDPGDFLCANPDGADDIFDCVKKFDCEATSDFSCHDTGEFTCTQQGGGANKFQCKSATSFECFSRFTCGSTSLFKCDKNGDAAYNCKSSYALCQSKTQKDCQQNYRCKSNHGCPQGAAAAQHNSCVSPNFNCNLLAPAPYNCAGSIPPYQPPPG